MVIFNSYVKLPEGRSFRQVVDSEIYLSGRERRADGRGLTLPVLHRLLHHGS